MQIWFIAIILIIFSSAQAKELTTADVVRMAVRSSPALKKAQAQASAAQADTKKQMGQMLPTISGVGSATTRDNVTQSTTGATTSRKEYLAYIEASQPLFAGGAITSGIRVLKADEKIAHLELRRTEHAVISEALQSYYSSVEALRLLTAARENLRIQKEYLGVIRRYAKIGRARRTDLMQAEVNFLSAEADVNELQAQHSREMANLRRHLVLDANQEVSIDVKIPSVPENISTTAAIKKALAANPAYLVEQTRRDRIENEKKLALSDDLPNLSVKGQLGYRATDESDLFSAGHEYSSATLILTIPLFSGLSSMYERRSYNFAREAQVREEENVRLEITTKVEQLINDLLENRKRLTIVSKAAIQARKALDMANRDYQKNLISTQDVVSLQRTRYDSDRLLIRTEISYLENILLLRQVMGLDLLEVYSKQ